MVYNKPLLMEKLGQTYIDMMNMSWIFSEWYEKAAIVLSILMNMAVVIMWVRGYFNG